MRKETMTYGLWQRIGALFLAAALVFGMLPTTGYAATTGIGTVEKIEDPETLTRPQEIYGNNTLNAGKVTVGKSVSKDAIAVDGFQIPLTDENNFLITISQSAQVMGLASQSKIPVDVVFVLDTSGSMDDNDRAESLVTAANSAIKTLMETNEENRVAVVAFSSAAEKWNGEWSDWGGGTAGGAAANVLSSLAHYTGDAASNHLQWVDSDGDVAADGGFIAGRDQTTITVSERQRVNGRWQWVNVQKNVNAFRNGKNGGTNIQAGIALGAQILTGVQNTTWTDPETNETVTRIPFLIVISDGQPTYVSDSEAWYNPTGNGQKGPGSSAYEGNGFISALIAAYYKGKVTEHYYGEKANAANHCYVYTMGVEIEALDDTQNGPAVDDNQALAQITLDPATHAVAGQGYYAYGNTWNDDTQSATNGWETYWNQYVSGTAFNVRVDDGETYTFTADSIADSRKYVDGIGYTGGLAYNDDYFAADNVADMEQIFRELIATIQEKAITVPTKVTTGDHDFDGYVTFTDPLGEYMEVKDMKGIIANDTFYQGVSAARFLATGENAAFNESIRRVLKTRMGLSDSDDRFATEAELDAFIDTLLATADGNSITWWGSEYHTGEEDTQVQVLAPAMNDSIAYITADSTQIPAEADYVCRSYFFYGTAGGTAGDATNHEFLYFVVRVQRSLAAPYQQTVVVSAPASLLSVEKVLVTETFDDNNESVYTVSVEKADPARVVYEVGLWETINEETISTIVSESYLNENVNGEGQVNYDPDTDTYYFFTNDWDRSEDQDHHHRAMAKATFDAAADNAFYTYQEDTLLVDADGNPVTADPTGTTAYYVRTYYDWDNAELNADGTYTAVKKTQLIQVDIPAGTTLISRDGEWYIPEGTYTASTLIVNGDDTAKITNNTNTASVVAHPHRTGDAGNSHYTVLLGNNGSISLKGNTPKPTKTVANMTANITDADGKAVMVGDELEYTITAKNYGVESGTITITDTVPAGTAFVSADRGITPDADGKLTWVLENVAAGAEVTVSFRVKVTEAALDNAVVSATIQNTATAQLNNGPQYDTNTTHNPPEGKKVVIQGDASGTSVQVGDVLQYSIEFHNDTGAVAEEIKIVDVLPAGTTFISADHNGVYDEKTHTVTWTFENVAAGTGGVVTFTVQVDASAQTPIENGATITIGDHESHITNKTSTTLDQGSLSLKKTVVTPEGLSPATDTFTLTLTDPTGMLNDTYSGITFVNGVATVEIRHGQTITIEGLAAGTTILVTEASYAGFATAITGNGQVVIPANGTAAVEVTNTYTVSKLEVILHGRKELTGPSPDNETFGFTVVPCNAQGEVLPDGVGITGEVTLAADAKDITFGKLSFDQPGIYHYLISEVNGGQTGVTYTTVQYLVTIHVTDNGDGTMGHTMTVKTRPDSSAAFTEYSGTLLFTNEYQPLSTELTLKGHKNLTGRNLKAGEFSFVVMEGNAVVSTGVNAADGTIAFTSIPYTEVGTHTYQVYELQGNLQGMTYSQVIYTITVEVADVDGQLVATVKDADGNPVDPASFGNVFTFTNVFVPEEVSVALAAQKELAGATLQAGQFSFVVYDEQGNEVASASNAADGSILFSKIEYALADLEGASSRKFTYTIRELVPDMGVDPSLYFDKDHEITVEVTVSYDASTGTLSVSEPVYSDDTVFNNIQNPAIVTVTPEGIKTVDSDMPEGVHFSFSVYTVDETAPNKLGTNVSSGVSSEDGKITFNPITYDYTNLGDARSVTFRYWIVEDQGGSTRAGITYDATRYLMVVTLSLSDTDALQTKVEYFGLKAEGDAVNVEDYTVAKTAAAFTNSYTVTSGTEVTMQVQKDLVNRELKAGEFEFGLYHNGNLVATATNNADGTVTFTRVYDPSVLVNYGDGKTATIIYEIRELNNNVHGVAYATNVVKVTVTVEDNERGGLKKPEVAYEGSTLFTNTYTPDPVKVALTGSKELTGRDLEAGEFSFVVIDKATGEEVSWGSNGSDGSITFSDLVYDFEDAGKTFTYIVKEVRPDVGADPNMYYDPATFEVTVTVSYDRETGKLTAVADYPADTTFNNIQNPSTISVKPQGTKTVTGENLPEGLKFSFRVLSMGTDIHNLVLGNVEATGVSAGLAHEDDVIQFTELVFDSDDVDKTFYFLVEEVPAEANTVKYSDAQYVIAVTIGRNSTNGLTKSVTYYAVAEDADATDSANWIPFQTGDDMNFVNEYSAYATLNIWGTKIMTGSKDLHGGEFDFRLQLLDQYGKPVSGSVVDGVNIADGEDNGTIEFGTLIFTDDQMKPEFVLTSDVNKTVYAYRVLISEIKPATNAIPGVTYSTQQYIAVIHWEVTTDSFGLKHYGQPAVVEIYTATENEGVYTATGTNLLTAGKTDKDVLEFTNKYEVTSGTEVTMQVQKDLVNRELKAGEFEFGLYHNGNLVATATNNADGTVTFTRVYDPSVLVNYGDGKTATITYEIRELNNNVHGVAYATNVVKVTITVEDNERGGLKKPEVAYEGSTLFTNTYTPDPVKVALTGSKELTGRDLEAGEFSFVVVDKATGEEVAWGSNGSDGSITFSDLVYDFEDAGKTFTYIVKEVRPDVGADPNMYYDPATFEVTVTVSYDRETGKLTAVAEGLEKVAFHNYQNPANIYVTPAGSKTTSGKVPEGTQFSFSVIEVESGSVVAAATSGPNGEFKFSTIPYDVTDVGTHAYWIVEDRAGETHAGITYDDTKYLMVVTIYQDQENHNALAATVRYFGLRQNGDLNQADHYTVPVNTAAFVNRYQVTEPATVEITVEKTLTGRDLAVGEFSFNLYHIKSETEKVLVATATNGFDRNQDGQITGNEIAEIFFSRTYAANVIPTDDTDGIVEIRYVIEEQHNGLGGVDYSKAVPVYVKVVITDRKNGTMGTQVTYYADDQFTQVISENPGFVNDYTTKDTVFTPEINKILTGRDMVNDEFSFQIADLNGNVVSYGLSKAAASGNASTIVFGNLTYTYQQYVQAPKNADGDAVFTYVISEIPGSLVNVNYTDAKIYLQVTVKDLGNGLMETSGTYYSDLACQNEIPGTPVFTNTYMPIGTTVQLEASKNMTGRAPVDGEFSFQVLDASGTVVATGGNHGEDGQIRFSGIGITAEMMGSAMQKDFIFTILELNTNQAAVKFDTNRYYAKVTVRNNLSSGMLEIAAVTYHSDPACTEASKLNAAVFTNVYAPDPVEITIPVHKDLINHTLKAEMFRFELKRDGQVIAQISNDEHGNALFQGLRYTVEDLADVTPGPNNVRVKEIVYTITEVSGTADAEDDNGTYTYDDTVYTVTVTLTDDGKGRLTASVSIRKDQDAADAVVFTNSFTPDPITVDLDTAFGAIKTIVDENGNVLLREDVEFTFVVTDLLGNEITRGTAKGADAVDGVMNIDFGTFTFTAEGEYRYLITESTATMAGYVLDTTVWCAHILVHYDPNTGKLFVNDDEVFTHILAAEGHTDDGIQSQTEETPAFVNVYDAADVQLQLTLDKVMVGERTTVKENEFTFHLLNEDGTIAAEARNHQDGTVTFYLEYTLQDLNGQPSRTFTYTVKEVIPQDAVAQPDGTYVLNGVTYDTRSYTLTVTVTDNGDGTLATALNGTAVTGAANTGIEFINSYAAADVDVSFHAIKRMEGMPLYDGIYTFHLMDGDTILAEGTNKADGTIVFDRELTFTEPGTYTYTMVEYKAETPGVTFDETSFTVTVEVTDNGMGNLEAKVIYSTADGIYDQPVFINIYKPASVSAVIEAQKKLNGRELREEFTFQLLDSENNVISEVKNAADGTITFESQRYDKIGTYTYTIVEVIPEEAVHNTDGTYTLDGVTYDQTVYTVVVEITDPGFDGTLDQKVTYYLGNEAVDAAEVVFTNTFTPDPITVTLDGTKDLTGREMEDDEFHFEVRDAEGNLITTGINKADGTIVFQGFEIGTEVDMILYVTEVKGNETYMEYDDYVYRVQLVVTNVDGVLTQTVTYLDGDIVFYNEYLVPETPPTGDETPVYLYMGLMSFSAVVLMAVLVLGRKKERKHI